MAGKPLLTNDILAVGACTARLTFEILEIPTPPPFPARLHGEESDLFDYRVGKTASLILERGEVQINKWFY